MGTIIGRIAAINRYPVKSMQGEELDRVQLDTAGIAGDRVHALRDLTTGKIVSAKVPKLGIPLLGCRATTTANGDVNVEIDGRSYLSKRCDAELSALLGREVRMESTVAMGDVYASKWPEIDGLALSGIDIDLALAPGSFADLAPMHLVATSSITHLASLLPDAMIDAHRFRPSILIETDFSAEPFVENQWVGQRASVGAVMLTFGLASPRCMMTTLPQRGLPRDPRVLQTIAAHNRRDFGGFGDFACLGIYAEVSSAGEVAVGDPIELLD